LKRLTKPPARVLVSPLLRTRQTAALLTQCAGWPKGVPCDALRPGAAPQKLLALLPRSRDARIAVIGHEPDLSALLTLCLDGRTHSAFTLRKMGVASVRFPGAAQAGCGPLAAFLPPPLLRAAPEEADPRAARSSGRAGGCSRGSAAATRGPREPDEANQGDE